MKWPVTQVGEKRIRRHFAWFPVMIEKTWVWLEPYYTEDQYYPGSWGDGAFWFPMRYWQ